MSSKAAKWPNSTPCWGRLPVEQYLIRYWDHASSEPDDEQRLRLVREYIRLDRIPKDWDPTAFGEAWHEPDANDSDPQFAPRRIPTDHECDKARGYPVMLRTYHGNGEEGNRRFAEYTQVSDTYHGVADCYALDDIEIFNFGSDWRKIFDILPEIAGCKDHQPDYDVGDIGDGAEVGQSLYYSRRPDQEILDDDYEDLKDEIENSKAEYPNWKEDPDALLEPGDTVIRSLLRAVTISCIIIVDEKTFSTDELRVVYLDMHQNITIETRLELDQGYIDEMLMRWEDGFRPLGYVMENGIVGEKYRLSNESGRRFFRVTDKLGVSG
ncbi:hypothetical protein BDV18DRAFT_166278 [Aspergillus unguis]